MTLMKYHTEAGSERRWKPYNGGTVGAWSNGGCLRVLPEHLLVRMMNGVCPRNIKKPVRYISVALLCHRYLRDSFFPLFSPFLCVPYVVGLLYHSIFRKNQEYCVSLSGKRSFFFLFDYCPWKGKTMPDRTRLQPVHSYSCLLDFQTGVTCTATNACSGLNRALIGVQSGTF